MKARAAGLLLGYAADRLLGDPRRFHPVAGFGTLAARAEQTWYADRRTRGIAHTLVLVGGATVTGLAAEAAIRHRPVARTLVTATATWAVLGGRSLEREADAVADLLAHDLPAARRRLIHLVGRDTTRLDPDEVARAVVESVAENTSDAVVAPLLLGALAGAPGLLGYRAANTLDAMVGHRSARYLRFGWASARLDDVLNLPGARLAAALAVLLGDRPGDAARAWRRDAAQHPSPNAGPVEAAFAGALGVRLGGANVYGSTVEDRGFLGDGRPVTPADIPRATRLARRVGTGAAVVATAVSLAGAPRRRRRREC
ncbi:cobalamin biosynthesis protein [Marmoricola sp. RAF53]|uniref:cobalamin biosynthesis protein n=1 Tax=Marmoricola sp. RAF53 TaxID=3233059 RepID=UPI003F94516B